MKKFLTVLSLLLALTLFLSGCGLGDTVKKLTGRSSSAAADDDWSDWDDEGSKSKKKDKKKDKKDKDADDADAEDSKEDGDEEDEGDEPVEEAASSHPDGDLTDSEIRELNDLINETEYNGFFVCEYDSPKNIIWSDALYNYNEEDGPSYKEVERSYLKKTREGELFGDLTYITEDHFRELVKKRTGYEYSDMRYPLDWIFLDDLGVYAFEHGDTNYIPLKVLYGDVYKGVYNIHIQRVDWEGHEFGDPFVAEFEKDGKELKLISNYCTGDPYASSYSEPEWDWTSEYILPYSDTQKLTESDLYGLSDEELRLARNEIYARHGRKFSDKKLQEYFDSKSWYYGTISPSDWSEKNLNSIETYNVKFISQHE